MRGQLNTPQGGTRYLVTQNALSEFWGAHACSVLVAAFCGDELFLTDA